MDISEGSNLERLSGVVTGLTNKTKVAILLGINREKSMKEIADELGITRQGLQNNLERMIDDEMVYRSEKENQTYGLTPIGELWVRFLEENGPQILEALDVLEEGQTEAEQEVRAVKNMHDEKEAEGFTFQIDEKAWERTIHTQKWERVKDEIAEMLEIPEEHDE